MKISLEQFRTEFTESLLDFIWGKWTQMGVFGSATGTDDWMTDPEALLPFSLEVARHDARVFDEIIDWLIRNGRWVNVHRVETIMKRDGIGDARIMGAVAAVLAEHDKSPKWRGMAERYLPEPVKEKEALFQYKGRSLKVDIHEEDKRFARYGFTRQVVSTRGLSNPVNMRTPGNFVFKARAIFGLGARADVMTYLIGNDTGHPRAIADLLAYNHMRVRNVLVELAEAGVVRVRPERKTKQYCLDGDEWWRFLSAGSEARPRWIDWRALVRGLTVLWRAVWGLREEHLDDYIFSSEMRKAMREAQDDLLAGGIGFRIEDDRGYIAEDYLPVFLRNIRRILGAEKNDSM